MSLDEATATTGSSGWFRASLRWLGDKTWSVVLLLVFLFLALLVAAKALWRRLNPDPPQPPPPCDKLTADQAERLLEKSAERTEEQKKARQDKFIQAIENIEKKWGRRK